MAFSSRNKALCRGIVYLSWIGAYVKVFGASWEVYSCVKRVDGGRLTRRRENSMTGLWLILWNSGTMRRDPMLSVSMMFQTEM